MPDDTTTEQTSPAPAATGEAPASTPEPSGAVESPAEAAGGPAATAATSNPTNTGGTTDARSAPSEKFDVGAWDGEITSLPEDVREFVRLLSERKSKDLEGGFTKKFQTLADERKAHEEAVASFEATRAQLENDLRLYRALADGAEDPRVVEFQAKVDELTKQVETITAERDASRQEYETYQTEQDKRWLENYKQRHADIIGNPEKKKDLQALLKYGWEEEAAAELVGEKPEVRETAEAIIRQHKLGPEGHRFAVQHAKLKLGLGTRAPRKPRPSADLTSGANGQVNPTSVPGGSLRELPKSEARREAARLALATSKSASR